VRWGFYEAGNVCSLFTRSAGFEETSSHRRKHPSWMNAMLPLHAQTRTSLPRQLSSSSSTVAHLRLEPFEWPKHTRQVGSSAALSEEGGRALSTAGLMELLIKIPRCF